MQKSVRGIANFAVNVTLPAFAAVRQAARQRRPPLSIDVLRAGLLSVNPPQRLSNDGANRRMDGRQTVS